MHGPRRLVTGRVARRARISSRRSRVAGSDVAVLNFLLLVEHLEAAFYADAVAGAARPGAPLRRRLRGELLRFAQVVGAHEQEHVTVLRTTLGPRARAKPTFSFGAATTDPKLFARTALALEDLSSGAYIGQGANASQDSLVLVAGIASVESRHSGWLRDVLGRNPAPHPADPALAPAEVLAAILRTGFVRRA